MEHYIIENENYLKETVASLVMSNKLIPDDVLNAYFVAKDVRIQFERDEAHDKREFEAYCEVKLCA